MHINALKQLLASHFSALQKSEMVTNHSKNCGYEKELCTILGMTYTDSRISDAEWDSILLEFKKGNLWVNAIRIAEQAQETPFQEVYWLHFGINKNAERLDEIICFKLSDFIKLLGLDDSKQATTVLESYNYAKSRGCGNNNQWSVTPDRLREIAQFIVRNEDYKPRGETVQIVQS
jgi:hypothetical protein